MQITVCGTKQVAAGYVKITRLAEPAFFIRWEYLQNKSLKEELLSSSVEGPVEFSEEDSEDIINAGLAFAAESAAVTYLERAEQCRSGLERKLKAKKHSSFAIKLALDYLESKNYLDDSRFARAWLRTHSISKIQGRSRLKAELCARGISRDIVESSLNEYFLSANEDELCLKAFEKYSKRVSDPKKIQSYLLRAGFSFNIVKKILSKTMA